MKRLLEVENLLEPLLLMPLAMQLVPQQRISGRSDYYCNGIRSTSRMVSKYRPRPQIIAVTPSRAVQRLLLVWGVVPLYAPKVEGTDAMVNQAIEVSLEASL